MSQFVLLGALGTAMLVAGLMTRHRAAEKNEDAGGATAIAILGALLLLASILSH